MTATHIFFFLSLLFILILEYKRKPNLKILVTKKKYISKVRNLLRIANKKKLRAFAPENEDLQLIALLYYSRVFSRSPKRELCLRQYYLLIKIKWSKSMFCQSIAEPGARLWMQTSSGSPRSREPIQTWAEKMKTDEDFLDIVKSLGVQRANTNLSSQTLWSPKQVRPGRHRATAGEHSFARGADSSGEGKLRHHKR